MLQRRSGEIVLYQFAALASHARLRHAISARHGGVSPAPFASLNLTAARGDDRAHVAENVRRLCLAAADGRADVVSAQQVHGAQIARVGRAQRGQIIPDCDGLVTDEPEVVLLLRFADCVPLIVYDPVRHAVGVAHAGWRGTVAGIARALVRAMADAFGSRASDLIAGVGPAIGPCCYQVGPEVVAQARAAFGATDGLFPQQADGSYHFDLWRANQQQLAAAGVGTIEVAGICTACRVDEFYSHRAERGRTGHHGALACLL
jgi:YfiH family protein